MLHRNMLLVSNPKESAVELLRALLGQQQLYSFLVESASVEGEEELPGQQKPSSHYCVHCGLGPGQRVEPSFVPCPFAVALKVKRPRAD